MGRKKRKIVDEQAADEAPSSSVGEPVPDAVEAESSVGTGDATDVHPVAGMTSQHHSNEETMDTVHKVEEKQKPGVASGYVMTSHSGDIIQEDIYVSDGSSDDDGNETDEVQIVLVGSRMGLMRRGLHHPSLLLQQPNRQWTRGSSEKKLSETDPSNDGEESQDAAAAREEQRRLEEEAELAKLDPAQRAARLLQEKQRKLEEAKEAARRMESELNAGRDPMLFSKRTAFDIRFDQIDDKPWLRGHGDFSDFFNYGLSEEDWLEYGASQLIIRQELIDASRQKRQPDPAIVPVLPRTTNSQDFNKSISNVDSKMEGGTTDELATTNEHLDSSISIGPVLVKTEEPDPAAVGPDKQEAVDTQVVVGAGGAWGAGAPPGSLLARLIEEQELSNAQPQPAVPAQRLEPFSDGVDHETSSSWQQAHPRRQHENIHHKKKNDDVALSDAYEDMSVETMSRTGNRDHYSGGRHRPDDYHGHGGGGHPGYLPSPQQGFRGRGRGRGPYGGRFGGRNETGPGRGPPLPPPLPPPPPWEGRGGANSNHYFAKKRPREGVDPRRQR